MADGKKKPLKPGKRFQTTRWSLVRAASDSADIEYRPALSDLCRIYWQPVHAYVRSRGADPEGAKDLTQGFFTQLLDKRFLKDARPDRGRFRSFLLTCVKHYLANEWDRNRALKRGGGQRPVTLDSEDTEPDINPAIADDETPDKVFEREWARTVLRRVFHRMEEEAARSGRQERYRLMMPHLTGEGDERPYKEIARELGMTEGAVKVAVHSLRKKLAASLREEIADTVADPESVDDEIRYLFAAMDL